MPCFIIGFICLNLGGVPLGRKNQGIRRFKLNIGAKAIESIEQSTDFLIPPLSYINHIMVLKRMIQQMRLPWKIKKICFKPLDGASTTVISLKSVIQPGFSPHLDQTV